MSTETKKRKVAYNTLKKWKVEMDRVPNSDVALLLKVLKSEYTCTSINQNNNYTCISNIKAIVMFDFVRQDGCYVVVNIVNILID